MRLGAGCFAPEQRGGGCRDGSAVISASGGCLKPHSVPWGRVCHRWTVGIRARAAFSVHSRSLVSWQQEAVPAPRSPPRARNRRWESWSPLGCGRVSEGQKRTALPAGRSPALRRFPCQLRGAYLNCAGRPGPQASGSACTPRRALRSI